MVVMALYRYGDIHTHNSVRRRSSMGSVSPHCFTPAGFDNDDGERASADKIFTDCSIERCPSHGAAAAVSSLFSKDCQPALSDADVGRTVTIEGDWLAVDGEARAVMWGDAAHQDCRGKILQVEPRLKGDVLLESGLVFENPGVGATRQASGGAEQRSSSAYALRNVLETIGKKQPSPGQIFRRKRREITRDERVGLERL